MRHVAPPGLAEEWAAVVGHMPPAVRQAVSTELWDRGALWSLPLSTVMMKVDEFVWLLDVPLWSVDGRPFQVTPNQVHREPIRFAEQYARTMQSDLTYPIHVVRSHGRWTILDGVHRLLKADIQGEHEIACKPLSEKDFSDILYR